MAELNKSKKKDHPVRVEYVCLQSPQRRRLMSTPRFSPKNKTGPGGALRDRPGGAPEAGRWFKRVEAVLTIKLPASRPFFGIVQLTCYGIGLKTCRKLFLSYIKYYQTSFRVVMNMDTSRNEHTRSYRVSGAQPVSSWKQTSLQRLLL